VESRDDARDIEAGFRVKLAKGDVGIEEKEVRKPRTIGELLDALKADYELRGKDSGTNLNIIELVYAEFGDRIAERLTAEDITRYVQRMRKEKIADKTTVNRLQILTQAYSLAGLEAPEIPKLETENTRTGFFSRADFDRVQSHLPADIKDFCLFGFLTGWRKGAVAKLEWSDVHDGRINLRGKLSKNRKPYYVPLEGEVKELIERREKVRGIETRGGTVLCRLVFHRNGKPVGEMRKSWATACKKAGCPGRLFHDLRRSAARQLIRSGVSETVAMQITGHRTNSMFKRYNITSEEDLRDAMKKVTKYNEQEAQHVVRLVANGSES
jgi:integrase